MDRVTRIIVNNKYFPSKGMASDVGGIISAKSKKNTVNERRMEEQSDTCAKSVQKKHTIINIILFDYDKFVRHNFPCCFIYFEIKIFCSNVYEIKKFLE